MKQFILFILVLLPVCAFAQFTETFDGPEINSANPWKGDLAKFKINNDGWLSFDGSRLADTCSVHTLIPYASTMEWELDVFFSFKSTTYNNARIYIYRTDKPSDLLFYIRLVAKMIISHFVNGCQMEMLNVLFPEIDNWKEKRFILNSV